MTEQLPFNLNFIPLEIGSKVGQFYEELKNGRFVTTKCATCEKLYWPPRSVCPSCLNEHLTWVQLSGRGRLFAFTEVLSGVAAGMERQLPILLGVVELDEGLRILSRISGTTFQELRIGMPMLVIAQRADSGVLLHTFVPAGKN